MYIFIYYCDHCGNVVSKRETYESYILYRYTTGTTTNNRVYYIIIINTDTAYYYNREGAR